MAINQVNLNVGKELAKESKLVTAVLFGCSFYDVRVSCLDEGARFGAGDRNV